MNHSETILTVSGLSRRFGYRYVVRDVSFELRPGDALLLIGHNGVGKTTLIRLLAGLLQATEGRVDRHGSYGVVAHDSMLYDSLSARENLRFFSRLYGLKNAGRIDELLQQTGLDEHADRRVGTYSRGMVQRLTLARALLPDPELLLLDEPLTGLDDAASNMVRNMIGERLSRGHSIVLATHQIAEVVDLASNVGFLISGKLGALEAVGGRNAAEIIERYRELPRDA